MPLRYYANPDTTKRASSLWLPNEQEALRVNDFNKTNTDPVSQNVSMPIYFKKVGDGWTYYIKKEFITPRMSAGFHTSKKDNFGFMTFFMNDRDEKTKYIRVRDIDYAIDGLTGDRTVDIYETLIHKYMQWKTFDKHSYNIMNKNLHIVKNERILERLNKDFLYEEGVSILSKGSKLLTERQIMSVGASALLYYLLEVKNRKIDSNDFYDILVYIYANKSGNVIIGDETYTNNKITIDTNDMKLTLEDGNVITIDDVESMSFEGKNIVLVLVKEDEEKSITHIR